MVLMQDLCEFNKKILIHIKFMFVYLRPRFLQTDFYRPTSADKSAPMLFYEGGSFKQICHRRRPTSGDICSGAKMNRIVPRRWIHEDMFSKSKNLEKTCIRWATVYWLAAYGCLLWLSIIQLPRSSPSSTHE